MLNKKVNKTHYTSQSTLNFSNINSIDRTRDKSKKISKQNLLGKNLSNSRNNNNKDLGISNYRKNAANLIINNIKNYYSNKYNQKLIRIDSNSYNKKQPLECCCCCCGYFSYITPKRQMSLSINPQLRNDNVLINQRYKTIENITKGIFLNLDSLKEKK